MSLKAPSLFLYGQTVTASNSSLDFQNVLAGPVIQATLTVGYYSLNTLLVEVKRALEAADPLNTYFATATRLSNGTNKVTVGTNGSFLSLLFSSGPRTASNCASLLGFPVTDQTGATSYQGTSTCGTALLTTREGYTYLPTDAYQQNFGKINVSTSGQKEAVVFSIQYFFQVQFKYITSTDMLSNWSPLFAWMIQQRPVDFTPQVTSPTTFYTATLESTPADGAALQFRFTEMLPDFPDTYDTGMIKFRKVPGT